MSPRIRKTVGAAALAFPLAAIGLASPAVAHDGDHEKWYEKVETCGAITDDPRCDEGGMDLWWKIPKDHDKWYSEKEHEKNWWYKDECEVAVMEADPDLCPRNFS